jgi:aspartate carbamoyltransferase catalytic subunit
MSTWQRRHLLGIQGLDREEVTQILDLADQFVDVMDRPVRSVPTLRGWTVVNLFFEDSTRTRISFELAEKRLGADIINFNASSSSVKKGESLRDTARNIEAMKIDAVVVRHKSAGTPQFLVKHIDAAIINAGDGMHEHPTQALLDMLTIRRRFGRIEGLKVAIVGDILHSRVARSDIWGLTAMGAEVVCCGPPTLFPRHTDSLPSTWTTSLDEALDGADVVYALRIQRERQDAALFPSIREYTSLYGITTERLRNTNDGAVIMHPGPVNRGWELSDEVVDAENSLVLQQVTHGVAVRMAVLYLTAGRDPGNMQSGKGNPE